MTFHEEYYTASTLQHNMAFHAPLQAFHAYPAQPGRIIMGFSLNWLFPGDFSHREFAWLLNCAKIVVIGIGR